MQSAVRMRVLARLSLSLFFFSRDGHTKQEKKTTESVEKC